MGQTFVTNLPTDQEKEILYLHSTRTWWSYFCPPNRHSTTFSILEFYHRLFPHVYVGVNKRLYFLFCYYMFTYLCICKTLNFVTMFTEIRNTDTQFPCFLSWSLIQWLTKLKVGSQLFEDKFYFPLVVYEKFNVFPLNVKPLDFKKETVAYR